MMIKNDFLDQMYIQIYDSLPSWREALYLAGEPLLHANIISRHYLKQIEAAAEFLGPYMDVGRGIGFMHARPEENESWGISLLKLQEPVYLLDQTNHPLKIVIVFKGKDAKQHLKILQVLSEWLANPLQYQFVCEATSPESIINSIKQR